MDPTTALLREAILALHENWTEYYGPDGADIDAPRRQQQFAVLCDLAPKIAQATSIQLVIEEMDSPWTTSKEMV